MQPVSHRNKTELSPIRSNFAFKNIFIKLIFSLPTSICSSSWLSSLEQGSLVHSSLHTQAYVEDNHFYGANTAIAISVS
jgi:hypothetical protein